MFRTNVVDKIKNIYIYIYCIYIYIYIYIYIFKSCHLIRQGGKNRAEQAKDDNMVI